MGIGENNVKNYIFIGAAGSGKTENALNLAQILAENKTKKVTLFDMDQTKGLFRARDHRNLLEGSGIVIANTTEFFDSPVVPDGVTGALREEDHVCVFDVGGNTVGARMIGQFSEYFTGADTKVLYILNPYRPFSDSAEEIEKDMTSMLLASGLSIENMTIVSNPCMGSETDSQVIINGHAKITKIAKDKGWKVECLTVKEECCDAVVQQCDTEVVTIKTYIENRVERSEENG